MNETISDGVNEGFNIMGDVFSGSIWAIIFWINIIIVVYFLIKYKVMK
jgi:hypothetical protein